MVENARFDEIRLGTTWADVSSSSDADPLCSGSATIDWTNNAGGTFTAAGNWQGGVVPVGCDIARFTNAATYALTHSLGMTNNEVRFNASSGVATVDLAGYRWRMTNALYVGHSSPGKATVFITNGILRMRALQVGASLSTGVLTLASVSNEVLGSGAFDVGLTGDGTFIMADERTVVNASGSGNHDIGVSTGARGTVIVSNGYLGITGGFYAGTLGEGHLRVVNGTNIISGSLLVASSTGSVGSLTLSGPGAYVFSQSGLTVGGATSSIGLRTT